MTERADDDDDFEPLECRPSVVHVEAYDVGVAGSDTVVRLFFRPRPGADPRPGNELADVLVLEDWDRVAIGLIRRVVAGDGPSNTVYGGEPLIRGAQVSLDVELREPLANRQLIDASTGEAVPRIQRTSSSPLPAEELGTPRWIRA
ncbi:hypothetical protein OJ997_31215 [Solirubrobacter phytolaccae]|uniref:Uncharacterized protein n=1 Tax=Solirubrobacter phytolaccae TaxID=1404360 RepID=A0A9X3NES9_9ACTN|nr:hypothetical protein [Solirubrobacter phytolaccae]MDA0184814.1 hypothetical protein [Solirubrobacter phytolaccae]